MFADLSGQRVHRDKIEHIPPHRKGVTEHIPPPSLGRLGGGGFIKPNVQIAKSLRQSMTDAEKILWNRLRLKQLGFKFRRQEPIGRYIVDFVCYESRLVIEIDGGQHFENADDQARDEWLFKQGFKVKRYWNNDVMSNLEGVLEDISNCLPSPTPPIKGGAK